jgi:hypothetical protein
MFMTVEGWKKFKNAIDATGIKKYQIDTDTDYHLFNDPENAKVILFDEGTTTFYNFRQKIATNSEGWNDPVVCTACDVLDIHMIKFGATPEKISQFIEQMGFELDDDQKEGIIKINKGNYDIKPITGDYVLTGFKVLTEEEIAQLSPQEKIDYEEKLKIYNNRQKLGANQAVQITY